MTREQAKQKLISLGVAEPTEEQISEMLNTIGAETKKEKDRADGYKAKADKADELQAEIDKINEQNMSDVEKANKELEKANARIAELERTDAIRTQRALAIDKFKITAEQANEVVKDDGSLDYEKLGQIIAEKETASANAKEQELANKAGNPGGGNGGGAGDGTEKSNAEKLVTKFFGGEKKENNILSHYVGGN